MKKISLLLVVVLAVIPLLTGCAATDDISAIIEAAAYHYEEPAERMNLTLGVASGPYGDMFMENIAPVMERKGYTINVTVYDDFVKPNIALSSGEVDLNMFQHSMYLNNFKFEHDIDISAIAEIPTVSMGVFSARYDSISDIPDGATALLPDDATNLARALRVLEASGIITLDPQTDKSRAVEADISRNPRGLVFQQAAANELVGMLPGVDLAVINGNFAYAGNLDIAGALYNEVLQEGYINVIAVRTEDLARQFVRDILDIVHSDDFKTDIENGRYSGFQRPRYLLN